MNKFIKEVKVNPVSAEEGECTRCGKVGNRLLRINVWVMYNDPETGENMTLPCHQYYCMDCLNRLFGEDKMEGYG